MKLIIQNSRIVGTATNDYAGPDDYITAPEGFDPTRLSEYVYADGTLSLAANSRITRLAFRSRFTQPEKIALEMAALDDPAAAMPARQQAAALRAYLADVAAATFIDLQRPDTRAGVQMLEAAELLAAGRAAEILDAPVQAHERPPL